MKIQIEKVDNKKDYLDESYYIISKYKALYKNPHKLILKKTTYELGILLFVSLYLLAVLLLSIKEKALVYYICFGASIVCLALVLTRFILVIKYLNKYNDNKINSELEINEEKIVLTNKTLKQETTINWNELERVLITKRCIIFMKKMNKNIPDVAILTPRSIETKVVKAIEKYNKEKYLIYNKKGM